MSGFPPEFITAVLAMTPVGELRVAMPVGITVLGLDPWVAFFSAILGNIVPLTVVFLFLPRIIFLAEKHSVWVKKMLDRYFHSLERDHKEKYDKYGALALVLFVAVPLPGSGVWTGSVLAVLFAVEWKYSVPAILLGLLLSGLLVLGITQGTLGILSR